MHLTSKYFARWRLLSGIILIFSLMGCSALLRPNLQQDIQKIQAGNYQLDKSHASLLFKVDHMGFSLFVGRFNDFDASLTLDEDKFENSYLEATVNMASVDVNNEKFERSLNSQFWLNTATYPQAFFKTIRGHKLDDKRVKFDGELTFLGVTHPIELVVEVNGAATNLLTAKYTMGFAASAQFKRSDFGLGNYIPAIGDTVTLEVHAEFQRL